jgi:uncharacterized protein (TIGR02246 family)
MSDEYVSIRQLCERYVDAVNRRDADDWGATWAPDGVWDMGIGDPPRGRDNVVEFWKAAMAGIPGVVMIVNSGVVDSVEGDTARAHWYHTEHLKMADGSRRVGMGVYRDDLVRLDGEWHFERRRYSLLYTGPSDLSGDFNPYPKD